QSLTGNQGALGWSHPCLSREGRGVLQPSPLPPHIPPTAPRKAASGNHPQDEGLSPRHVPNQPLQCPQGPPIPNQPLRCPQSPPPPLDVPAGAPPPAAAPPRPKRAAWDLKGQVSDLREALGSCREKVRGLDEENRLLREQVGTLQRDLRERESQEKDLNHRMGVTFSPPNGVSFCPTPQPELLFPLLNPPSSPPPPQAQLKLAEETLQQHAARAAELQVEVAAQEQQLGQQEERLHGLEMERRRLHNLVQELKGNIRVFCRVRPVLPEEEERQKGLEHLHFPPQDNKVLVLSRPEESHVGRERRGDIRYDFSFDRVFPPSASQQEIFEEIALLVQSALDGYHVCIFAYGQTGSGKTYTMEGPDALDPETRGMIPRAVQQVFQGARELTEKGWEYGFTASFLEIYNESLRDLLAGRPERGAELEIRRVSSISEELHVPNLRCVPVTSEEEVLGLLQTAAANRSVARTALNDRSSRSHCVFQLRIQGSNPARDLRCASVLSLVDLAGSERLDKSLSRGERLRETQAINTSLSTLGLVIMALSNKEPHVPYRNSKLTYLLQNSLGGSAKMLMFVNISPLEENFAESLNSLRFASKVNECVVGTAHANRK
uniref:Kinesin-like protein n=1 Tax=Accipiter nisus TaxID=211598 RepID=A0A8B9RXF0_9AVES